MRRSAARAARQSQPAPYQSGADQARHHHPSGGPAVHRGNRTAAGGRHRVVRDPHERRPGPGLGPARRGSLRRRRGFAARVRHRPLEAEALRPRAANRARRHRPDRHPDWHHHLHLHLDLHVQAWNSGPLLGQGHSRADAGRAGGHRGPYSGLASHHGSRRRAGPGRFLFRCRDSSQPSPCRACSEREWPPTKRRPSARFG